MRDRLLLLIVALLLLSAAARAQAPQPPGPAQPPQAPQPPPAPVSPDAGSQAVPASSLSGSFDFGGLMTSATGDAARYERYRDTRDGVATGLTLNRLGRNYRFDGGASHIGYRDQRYDAALMMPKVNVDFRFTGQPLNHSYITRTPYTGLGTSVLRLDDSTRAAVQGPGNATTDGVVGVPCAPGGPPAACSNPAQAALALANRSVYNDLASLFDLRQTRDTTAVGLVYTASRAIDVDARFVTSGREGQQPWGASYAFNNAVEIPLPIQQRSNDLTLGASWARPNAMFRLGWDGSWFANDIHSVTWDNPIRLTDFSNGLAPPLGPWDPSGYSNGNGAATGRLAHAPGNTMHVVSATGLYKFGRRSTVNGVFQLSSQSQDEDLIPWTSNSVILSPVVFAAFPNLADLPRPTAEAEAKGVNALLNFSSRPNRRIHYTARYRYNERDVQTPVFDARQYVRADATPYATDAGLTHQFDTERHIFDTSVAFTPALRLGTFRAGYGHEAVERHGRGFSDVGEHILRLSYDVFAHQYISVRGQVDLARRRGEGFVDAASGDDEDDALLEGPGGTQPTLRYYDEADRDRRRGSVLVSAMPFDILDVYVQFAGGRDEYMADASAPVSRPGELFGLLESTNTSWNVGFTVQPAPVLVAGASYGRDHYGSFQRSRNANPPPDPTWTDPERDWTLDNDDETSNASVYVEVLGALRNTDLRFGYDYSGSSNSLVHGGPRILTLAAANQFIPLPAVDNTWQRVSLDAAYYFTRRIGVGIGYYFEKLDIVDFNTVDEPGPNGFTEQTGYPRIDYLGGLLLGYGNRPYAGHSAQVRLLYRFGGPAAP